MNKWTNSFRSGSIFLNQKYTHINGNDASIAIHYWGAQSKHYNNHVHQHSFFELCYVVDGNGKYIDDENICHLKKGTLFLSRPYIKHQILSKEGLNIIFVGFEIEESKHENILDLFEVMKNTDNYLLEDKEDSVLVNLWTSILSLASYSNSLLNDSLYGLCSAFFSCVLKDFAQRKVGKNKQRKYRVASNLVYQAKIYIKDNLSESLSLERVADYLHISGRHLSRVFHDELGQSFTNYVKKEKVRKAGILLSETNLPIKEISEMTGFKSLHYFSKVFADEMEMPPGKFRDRFQQVIK